MRLRFEIAIGNLSKVNESVLIIRVDKSPLEANGRIKILSACKIKTEAIEARWEHHDNHDVLARLKWNLLIPGH